MRVEFEWAISEPNEQGLVGVRERLVGSELVNFYGPLSRSVAEAVIKARRAFVNRTITSRTSAMQIFEPRPNLEAIRLFQSKGHLDS